MSNNQTVLITGASGGMGKEFTLLFATDNYNLVLVDRDETSLKKLANELQTAQPHIKIHTITQDLTADNAAKNVIDDIDKHNLHIDILVNNAGFGIKGRFINTEPAGDSNMVKLNVLALTELSKYLAPRMVKKSYGKILNTASTAAYQPGPGMAVYFATKAYVKSFSQALYEELRGTGVTVTTLCPGPTLTEFAKTANLQGNPIHDGLVPMWEPKAVAEHGYKALLKGKRLTIVGKANAIYTFLAVIFPKSIVMRLIRRLHDK